MVRKLLVLALLALLAACAPAPKKPQPVPPTPSRPAPPAPTRVEVNGLEQAIIEATNDFRREHALGPLAADVRLIVIAQNHARNMARQDKFGDSDKNGHVLDGRDLAYRIQVGGYTYARVAENVGFQLHRPDPAGSMMAGWRQSTGHRRNMLLPDITEIGVGAAQGRSGRWYFVQVFGRPAQPAHPIKTTQ